MSAARLSVVVPVFNEAPALPELHRRLRAVLDALGTSRGIEGDIIAVDDGSRDGSPEVLEGIAVGDTALRVIRLDRNRGQHEALIEGFTRCRSPLVISMDADLQNPPEEIPRIVDALLEGYDLVATRRVHRRDPLSRRMAARLANATSALLSRRFTPVPLHDVGCMLRGYSGGLVRLIVRAASTPGARPPFVPALALRLARSVCEVDVRHDRRSHGRSRYRWPGLLDIYFRLLWTLAADLREDDPDGGAPDAG